MIDHVQVLHLAAGVFLLTAVGVLWRRQLPAKIRLLVVQGLALAAMVGIIGVQRGDLALVLVAAGLAVLRAGVMPAVLRRALVPGAQERRETRPVVDVAASLLAAALLTLLAYALTRPLVIPGIGFGSPAPELSPVARAEVGVSRDRRVDRPARPVGEPGARGRPVPCGGRRVPTQRLRREGVDQFPCGRRGQRTRGLPVPMAWIRIHLEVS